MIYQACGLDKKKASLATCFFLAGVAGFEPTNKGVKVLCLTAWRYPYLVIKIGANALHQPARDSVDYSTKIFACQEEMR